MRVRIEGSELPGGTWGDYQDIHVALQVGREPHEPISAAAARARWETEVLVVPGEPLEFRGPAVQGKKGERFLYLTWGEMRGGSFAMFRRIKLMLVDLGPGARDATLAVAQLSLTGAQGDPFCGRAKPGAVTWTLS